jgi:hypothetical protein
MKNRHFIFNHSSSELYETKSRLAYMHIIVQLSMRVKETIRSAINNVQTPRHRRRPVRMTKDYICMRTSPHMLAEWNAQPSSAKNSNIRGSCGISDRSPYEYFWVNVSSGPMHDISSNSTSFIEQPIKFPFWGNHSVTLSDMRLDVTGMHRGANPN